MEAFRQWREYIYENELTHYRDVARLNSIKEVALNEKCSDSNQELARRLDTYTRLTAQLAGEFARVCVNDLVLGDVAKSEGVQMSNTSSHVEATLNQLCRWY